jgi:hypothetical protein
MTTLQERLNHLVKIAWNTPEATVTEKALAQEEMNKLWRTREGKALQDMISKKNTHRNFSLRHELQSKADEATKKLKEYDDTQDSFETVIELLGSIPCPKV